MMDFYCGDADLFKHVVKILIQQVVFYFLHNTVR